MNDMDEIEKRFTPIAATEEQAAALNELRHAAMLFTLALRKLCPKGRRLSVAETHVETAAMFATKAVTHS